LALCSKKRSTKKERCFELNKYLKKLLPFYQKMGVNLIPNHYEEPIPDLAQLKNFNWEKESELLGIRLQAKKQSDFFNQLSKYFPEFKKLPQNKTTTLDVEEYHHSNPSFRGVDAGVYYSLIRRLKPRRIIEIGAGFSTFLAAQAVVQNKKEKHPCDLTAVEPYPSQTLRQGIPGLKRLVEMDLQKVPLREFERLGKNDILFIDSSHVLKMGSDVQYEFLEILPRLKKGVFIHFHDIFMPREYPRKLTTRDFKFYNEQYLLQAFLAFNPDFEVVWAGQYMYRKHYPLIEKYFGGFFRDGDPEGYWRSVSFWIRRK
jgi:predicted O-methyltransferase YrrM